MDSIALVLSKHPRRLGVLIAFGAILPLASLQAQQPIASPTPTPAPQVPAEVTPTPTASPAASPDAPKPAAPADPSPAPTAAPLPAPTPTPSLRDTVNTLSAADLQEAISVLKAGFIHPDQLADEQLSRALLEGVLTRLGAGASLVPAAAASTPHTPAPFYAEIWTVASAT